MEIVQTPGTIFKAGVPLNAPNEVRQNDPRFSVSYCARPGAYGCPTTALVVNDPDFTKFYILRGDHREQYDRANTLEACIDYFASMQHQKHDFSDTLDVEPSA